jgi:hypothetical protein
LERDGRAHAGARPEDAVDVEVASEEVHAVRGPAQAGAGGGIGRAHRMSLTSTSSVPSSTVVRTRAALAFA